MALRGEAAKIPLSNIFQTLSMGRQNGILLVSWDKIQRRFYFIDGMIKVLANKKGDVEPLKKALINQHILTDVQFNNVVKTLPPNALLGDALIDRRVISLDQVASELNIYFCELIFDVFLLKDAYFFFSLNKADTNDLFFSEEKIGDALTFDSTGLLMESARREDEWKRIRQFLPDLNEIFYPVDQNQFIKEVKKNIQIEELVDEFIKYFDGNNTLSTFLRKSPFSNFDLLQPVSTFVEEGLLKPLDSKSKKKLAKHCKRKFLIQEAVEIYESILKKNPEDIEVRKDLVLILEKKDKNSPILIEHWRYLAAALIEKKEFDTAQDYLRKVLKYFPNDISSIANLYKVLLNLNQKRDAVQEAHKLKQCLRGYKDSELALKYIEGLVQDFPNELSFKHDLARIQKKAGKTEASIETLRALASIYEKTGAMQNLRRTYEALAHLDPKALRRYKNILSKVKHAKKKRFRSLQNISVKCIVTLLVAGILFVLITEFMAYRNYAHAEETVNKLISEKKYGTAKSIIQDKIKEFKYSTTKVHFRKLLNKVEDAIKKDQLKHDNKKEKQIFDLKFRMSTAKILKSKGNWIKALEVATAISTDTLSAQEIKELNDFKGQLQSYMDEASNLFTKSNQLAKSNRWREVFNLRKELLAKYPFAKESQNIYLPLKVESTPGNAEIYLNNKYVATTPYVVSWSANNLNKLKIKKKSYSTYNRTISYSQMEPRIGWSLSISLRKLSAWEYGCEGVVEANSLFNDDKIFIGDRSGKVYSLDCDSGSEIWKKDLGEIGGISSDLRIWKGNIVCLTVDGKIYLLSKNGKILFSRELYMSAPIRLNSSIPDGNGNIAAITEDGEMVAYSLDKKKVSWTYRIPSKVSCGIASANGRLYIGDLSGLLWTFDQKNGKVISRQKLGGSIQVTPVVYGKSTLVVASGNKLVFMNKDKPSEAVLSSKIIISPAITDKYVYVVVKDNYLNALDRKNLKFLWKIKLPGKCRSIAARPGWIYVSSANEILAINSKGQIVWRFAVDKNVWNLMVINSEYLVASGDDRKIRLFDLKDDK